MAGGGGGWAFGLAPNPSCDQGSSAFYSFSILMFCGRFCLSIVLFPIVHKKVCKLLGWQSIDLVRFQVLQGLNEITHHILSTAAVT